jgi:CDP-paratose synthetase
MNNDRSSILVTGATGFIGRHLCKALLARSYSVVALVRDTSDCSVLPQGVQSIKSLEGHSFEGVVHLATHFLAQHQMEDIPQLLESNVIFGTLLCESVSQLQVPWFINTSTFWQHYNGTGYSPVNLYAASKQAMEALLAYYQETTSTHFVTLELCDTFGPNDTRKKIISLLKQTALSQQMLKMSPGEQRMNMLYIDDVISGLIALVTLLEEKKIEKQATHFCLSASEMPSLKDVVKQFEEIYQVHVPVQFGALPYRPREMMNPVPLHPLVPGWEPHYTLMEGLIALKHYE